MGPRAAGQTDPLRYEKRLIDDWAFREFKADARSAAR